MSAGKLYIWSDCGTMDGEGPVVGDSVFYGILDFIPCYVMPRLSTGGASAKLDLFLNNALGAGYYTGDVDFEQEVSSTQAPAKPGPSFSGQNIWAFNANATGDFIELRGIQFVSNNTANFGHASDFTDDDLKAFSLDMFSFCYGTVNVEVAYPFPPGSSSLRPSKWTLDAATLYRQFENDGVVERDADTRVIRIRPVGMDTTVVSSAKIFGGSAEPMQFTVDASDFVNTGFLFSFYEDDEGVHLKQGNRLHPDEGLSLTITHSRPMRSGEYMQTPYINW